MQPVNEGWRIQSESKRGVEMSFQAVDRTRDATDSEHLHSASTAVLLATAESAPGILRAALPVRAAEILYCTAKR